MQESGILPQAGRWATKAITGFVSGVEMGEMVAEYMRNDKYGASITGDQRLRCYQYIMGELRRFAWPVKGQRPRYVREYVEQSIPDCLIDFMVDEKRRKK